MGVEVRSAFPKDGVLPLAWWRDAEADGVVELWAATAGKQNGVLRRSAKGMMREQCYGES